MSNLLVILTSIELNYLSFLDPISKQCKLYVILLDYDKNKSNINNKRINMISEYTDKDMLVKNDIDIIIIVLNKIRKPDIKNDILSMINKYKYVKPIQCFSDIPIDIEISNKYLTCHDTCKVAKIKSIYFSNDKKEPDKNEKKNTAIQNQIVPVIPKKNENVKNKIQSDFVKFSEICLTLLNESNLNVKEIKMKEISKTSIKESVFIEFRVLPHSEDIIRNCIHKLDTTWSHTVVCGNDNYAVCVKMCNKINANIRVVKLDVSNGNQNSYNNLLLTKEFWNLFNGEKILIYQSDSYIFKSNIDDFLHYDYVGSPFITKYNMVLAKEQVGNGGLSLRSKSKMLEVLDKVKFNIKDYSGFICSYARKLLLNFIPEDIYFSQNMQNYNIGNVAPYDVSMQFGINTVYSEDCFGMHAMWYCCKDWVNEFIRRVKNSNSNSNSNYSYFSEKNVHFTRKINSKPYEFLNGAQTKNITDIGKFIFVLDFHNGGGGATVFLNFIVSKYKHCTNFVVARTYNNKIALTLNDDSIIEMMNNENELMTFLDSNVKLLDKIFVNHSIGFSTKFIEFLFNFKKYNNKKMYTVTHDYIHIFSTPLATYETMHNNKTHKNSYDINNFDEIITQHKTNLDIYDKYIVRKDMIKIEPLPDYYAIEKSIKTANTQVVIGIIGNIHKLKGYDMLKKITKKYVNQQFVIFGISYHMENDNVIFAPYNSISELNELLILHKPNIMLELSISPETYSYIFTLYSIINLPVIILNKPENSVIISRAKELNVEHYIINNEDDVNLYLNVAKSEFNTINPEIRYNEYWDNLFGETSIAISTDNMNTNIKNVETNIELIITNKPDISIVMAYYNDRKEQTLRTLDSFEKQYAGKYDFEVIIVDDNSNDENNLHTEINKYSFPINLIVISAEEKGDRINPCVAYNRGFKEAKGNTIIIQNPECLHLGNLLDYIKNNFDYDKYISFPCYNSNNYAVNEYIYSNYDKLTINNIEFYTKSFNRDDNINGFPIWYQHPEIPSVNKNLHFCTVINSEYLKMLDGFNESYKYGICYEDDEFVFKIKNILKLNVVSVELGENIGVVHLFHRRSAGVNISPSVTSCKQNARYEQYSLNKNLFEYQKNINKEISCPKIFHYYWDDFKKFSYMNLYSLKSSVYYHPDYIHVIWCPINPEKNITWNENCNTTSNLDTNWEKYVNDIKQMSNVRIIYKNMSKFLNVNNNMSEIHKSDLCRYKLLEIYGGIWSDLDIVYIKPITDVMNFEFDTVNFLCKNETYCYVPIGLMLSKRKSNLYQYIFDTALLNYDKNRYQCFGSELLINIIFDLKGVSNNNVIPHNLINKTNIFLDEKCYMNYNWTKIDDLFINDEHKPDLFKTIGFHWFNGSHITKKYLTEITQYNIPAKFNGIIFNEKYKFSEISSYSSIKYFIIDGEKWSYFYVDKLKMILNIFKKYTNNYTKIEINNYNSMTDFNNMNLNSCEKDDIYIFDEMSYAYLLMCFIIGDNETKRIIIEFLCKAKYMCFFCELFENKNLKTIGNNLYNIEFASLFFKNASQTYLCDTKNINYLLMNNIYNNISYFPPITYSEINKIIPLIQKKEKQIDILFYGNIFKNFSHRNNIIEKITELTKTNNYNFVLRKDLFGDEKNDILSDTKIVIHIPSHKNLHSFPWAKCGELMAKKVFFIIEENEEMYIQGLDKFVVFYKKNDVNDIINKIDYYLKNINNCNDIINNCFDYISKKFNMDNNLLCLK